MPNQASWRDQNKLFTVKRCQQVKLEESSQPSEGLLCKQTFYKSTFVKDPSPCTSLQPVPTPEGAIRGSFSEEESCYPDTQQLMLITNSRWSTTGKGRCSSSICCIKFRKVTWLPRRFPLLRGCSQQPSWTFQCWEGSERLILSQGISSNERFTFPLMTLLPVLSFMMFSVFLQITLSCMCTISDWSCKAHVRQTTGAAVSQLSHAWVNQK